MTNTIAQASVARQRIQYILRADDISYERLGAAETGWLKGEIDLDHVAFGYHDDPPVLRRVFSLVLAVLVVMPFTLLANTAPDYEFLPVLATPLVPGEVARPTPKFIFMFGEPAKWATTYAWRYNPANAPPAFASATIAVNAIKAAFDKWTASCNVQYRYDGLTSTPPNNRVQSPIYGEQPDYENVVGWAATEGNVAGLTYAWYSQPGGGVRALVDSDIVLSTRFLLDSQSMDRTASHEFGHAIGLAHSNIDDALMSGPPDSDYNWLISPAPDDVRGCRCLYGPAPGQAAAYTCSLPRAVDFGQVPAGDTGTRTIPVRNDGNTILMLGDWQSSSPVFRLSSGCPSGTALAPGESCSLTLAAVPQAIGTLKAQLVLRTSDGDYRLPLVVDATPPAGGVGNYTGLWWNAPAGSENGWGLNIAHQGDLMFVTWFTYDAAGKGWWLSMVATLAGDGVFAGDLLQTKGPPFDTSPFNPSGNAATSTKVGTAMLDFKSVGGPRFSATVNGFTQTKTLTLQVLGEASPPTCVFGGQPDLALATNFQDLWWAAGGIESGWGINLTHQGDTIFATWFTYDIDGTPMWLVATTNKTGAGVYTGTLSRTTGSPFGSSPYDNMKFVSTAVGSATFTFTHGNAATFSYTVNGIAQTKAIARQVLLAPGTVCQ